MLFGLKDALMNIVIYNSTDGMISLFDAVMFLLVSVGPIIVEAYTFHRMLKVPCKQAVPRLFITNVACFIVQFFVAQMVLARLFMLILEVYDNNTIVFFGFNIIATLILFLLHMFITCQVYYRLFDSSIVKNELRKVVFFATVLSRVYLFMIVWFLG